MNAYYQGTKTAYDLYEYYKNESAGTPKDWLEYIDGICSTRYAYLEFKLYILNYLLYAKQYRPSVYNSVLANEAFMKAYRAIDANWSKLIADVETRKAEMIKYLKETKGYQVRESDGNIFIQMNGRSLFTKQYDALADELARPVYAPVLAALTR
jgi:hypothetical protein